MVSSWVCERFKAVDRSVYSAVPVSFDPTAEYPNDVTSAPSKSALCRFAPRRFAPSRCTFRMFASCRFAPCRSALHSCALGRFALCRSAPRRSALDRFASRRFALCRGMRPSELRRPACSKSSLRFSPDRSGLKLSSERRLFHASTPSSNHSICWGFAICRPYPDRVRGNRGLGLRSSDRRLSRPSFCAADLPRRDG